MKLRGIYIKRTVSVERKDKNGNTVTSKEQQWFPCSVNASVPFNHRMLK